MNALYRLHKVQPLDQPCFGDVRLCIKKIQTHIVIIFFYQYTQIEFQHYITDIVLFIKLNNLI